MGTTRLQASETKRRHNQAKYRARHDQERKSLGDRLKQLRQKAGLSQEQMIHAVGCSITTYRGWESGAKAYQAWRAPDLASALGLPVAQLFSDDNILAELRVSELTLQACRREGRQASMEAATRMAASLEPLIWAAATQRPVDARQPRAKRRKSRAEVLAGLERLKAHQSAKRHEQRNPGLSAE